ncbi:MAG: DMT family protein [Gammaproteobacteria bacterium]
MSRVMTCVALLPCSHVFVPFAAPYLQEPLKLDYLWAGLCLVGAEFFMFRSRIG